MRKIRKSERDKETQREKCRQRNVKQIARDLTRSKILRGLFLHHCHYSVNNNSDNLSFVDVILLRSSVLIKCHEDATGFRVEIPRRPVTGQYTIQSIELSSFLRHRENLTLVRQQTLKSMFSRACFLHLAGIRSHRRNVRFSCPINWFEGQQKRARGRNDDAGNSSHYGARGECKTLAAGQHMTSGSQWRLPSRNALHHPSRRRGSPR